MKLTEFINPISGQKGNLTNISTIWSMILGVFVFLFVFATGQRFANYISNRVPPVDTTPEPLWKQEAAVQPKQSLRVI